MNFQKFVYSDLSQIVDLNQVSTCNSNLLVERMDLKLSGRRWVIPLPKRFFLLVDPKTISIILESNLYSRYLRVEYNKGDRNFVILSYRRFSNLQISVILSGYLWGTKQVYNVRLQIEGK